MITLIFLVAQSISTVNVDQLCSIKCVLKVVTSVNITKFVKSSHDMWTEQDNIITRFHNFSHIDRSNDFQHTFYTTKLVYLHRTSRYGLRY